MAAAGTPSDNVFFTELPRDIDEPTIRSIFGAYGAVSQCKVLPPNNPQQLGAALVRFTSAEDAAWVVENLNGNIPQGLETPVQARFANSQSQGKGGKNQPGGELAKGSHPFLSKPAPLMSKAVGKGEKGGKSRATTCDIKSVVDGLEKAGALPGVKISPDENCLYIRGLPANTTDVHLYRIFNCFGPIPCRGVKAMVGPDGSCTGIGFVDFNRTQDANTAVMTLNGTTLPDGSILSISTKRPRDDKAGKGKTGGGKGLGGLV
mmetsp:Transcript_67631/g.188722  ORF Transcript_67631/g.188722 Transcript_67631/m.188722 type:complete len:262 (-) Transcript_67631:70-855(-)